jgi:iron(III) transport system ATP-binding protein
LQAQVTRVEFLGGVCIAEVTSGALGGQSLGLGFTLGQMRDLDIREGNTIDLALNTRRIRTFPARASAS